MLFLAFFAFAMISCGGNESAAEEEATAEVEEVTPPPPPPPPVSAQKRSVVRQKTKAQETPEEFHAIEESEVHEVNDVKFVPHRFTYQDLETTDEPLNISMKAFDVPPIFGKRCVDDDTPDDCSHDAIEAYLENNIDFPDEASNFDGITEYVTFMVEADGSVDGSNIQLLPLDPQCRTCAAEALELIRDMPKWTPAQKGGTPVPARVTVPITFKAN
jgi:protein TonB